MNKRLGMRLESNRTDEMVVFTSVVEHGDFSQAGRVLGLSPSGVSKLMTRLERRLGVALLRRSTRHIGLTLEGELFHTRVLRILADIEVAEHEASGTKLASGRIRVSSSASYVAHMLADILPKFLSQYHEVSIDITQSDMVVDLLKEGTDIAIRAGELPASNLIARSLGNTRLIVVASPLWIEQHGMPASVEDLVAVDRLGFAYERAGGEWLRPTESILERVRVSDGEGIRRLALAGVAPARIAEFTIRKDLAAGRLVPLLPDLLPVKREPFHAVYAGKSSQLPARIRVFLDYLTAEGRVE
ncbi:LysR family transcriptional regulator [Paraburkholderia sp. BCC1885]|uniref:LysR family transcriptional regulator n=1 Tax=Paraburkholderia sp. BCC1885 TaxID=2562669 RepID=UPI001C9051BF|nr:LysR family transcriptional regulator [Paraburkholderia sp. BCC1885]